MPVNIAGNYERIEDEHWRGGSPEAHDQLAAGEDEVIPFSEVVADTERRYRVQISRSAGKVITA